jgi:3-deoxy-D-manno-octulosonate 8-phosphate phosphatase (KDO 8-P phosphatase)
MKSYKEKLSAINTFVFDIDGVFTNGKVMLFQGEMLRFIDSKDAYAVQYAAKMGFKIFIISGGHSIDYKNSLLSLGATEVCLQSANKLEVYTALKNKHTLENAKTLYMGDDIPDIQLLQIAGVSACPQDAVHEVKSIVDYQSPYKGGELCVRDIIEQTLRVQNLWLSEMAFHW